MNRSKGYGATPGDYEPVNHFERDVANEMLTRADDRIRALEAALRELWNASEGCSDREINARLDARALLTELETKGEQE